MMKTRPYMMVLAVISLTIPIASGVAETSQQKQGGMSMKEMSAMKQEPHHVLATAYKDNLVCFAKALRQEAAEAKTVNLEFARAAVAEMKRSFDQMQQHHQDHMKTMDEKMKAQMADMMKQMDAHCSAIQEHLAALDKEVQTSAPDAKRIADHVAEILTQCDGMAKMHGGSMKHKMSEHKDHKMN